MNNVTIEIKRLDENAQIPQYETTGSAGMDIRAIDAGSVTDTSGPVMIHTGLSVAIPEGYEIQVRPRSGLAIKHGVTVLNSPGTIDSDYRGEICVILACTRKGGMFTWSPGDRVAQLVVSPVTQGVFQVVEELDSTERGQNGFGSTGV